MANIFGSAIEDRIKRARTRNRAPNILTPLGANNSLPGLRTNREAERPGLGQPPHIAPSGFGRPYNPITDGPRPSTTAPAGQTFNPGPTMQGYSPTPPPAGTNPYTPGSQWNPSPPAPAGPVGTPIPPTPPGPTSPYGRPLTGPVPQEQWAGILAQNPQLTDRIRSEYLSRFGMIPGGEGTLVGLLNKIYNEGYPLERIMQMIQENGYNVPEDLREAADLVQLEYGPQEQGIERTIEAILRQMGIDINAQQNFGQIYDQSIENIYGDLNTQLGQLNAAIPGIWNRASQQGQQAYSGALSGMQGNFDQSVAKMQGNAAELGIEAGLDETIAALAQSIAPNQQALASEQGSLGQLFSGLSGVYQSSGNRLQGIQMAEGAQQRAQLANQVLADTGQIRTQGNEAVLEQRGLLSDLSANRGAALRTAYEQIQDQNWEQQFQQQQADLAKKIQEGTLAIQQGQLGIQQGQLSLDQQRFKLEEFATTEDLELRSLLVNAQVAQIYQQIRSAGVQDDVARAQIQQILAETSLTGAEQQQVMANIGLTYANTGYTNAQTGYVGAQTSETNANTGAIFDSLLNGGATDPNNPNANTGYTRLNSYYTGPGAAINADGRYRNMISTIITGAEANAYSGALGLTGDGAQQDQDPRTLAYNSAIRVMNNVLAENPQLVAVAPADVWLNAIRAYFNI